MPINPTQLAIGTNYQLETYAQNEPVDQVNTDHPLFQWFVSNKIDTPGGNTYFNEKVRIANDSNYQNYYGDDQVTYNRKDTVRLAKYPWSNFHDGFGVNEDELAANGINLIDSTEPQQVSDNEKFQIVDMMKENFATLKLGAQENFSLEVHQDGSGNTKAVPGLDFIVSTTPTVGVVGGIDASLATYWRNNASMAIASTAGVLTTQMEVMFRACMLYGKRMPNKIICGQTFLDKYRAEFQATIVRQAQTNGKMLAAADVGTEDLYFHGIKLEWDPDFERLDVLLGAITYPWTKRCYFLQSDSIKMRPVKGHWMVNRKPPRLYDRYVYYFGITSKYRITARQRNSMAVLSVA
jgi:hypothetical protein